MENPHHKSMEQLQAGLGNIIQAPKEMGKLELIVCRPSEDERRTLEEGQLELKEGLVGDTWRARGSNLMPDGSAHPNQQVAIMNSRVISLLAGDKERWPMAGDQLYVDMDLSGQNLPPGTFLSIGGAILRVTEQPHTGCTKFMARFGKDALSLASSPIGRELNMRGIYARVIRAGNIRPGDRVEKSESIEEGYC